MNEFIFVAIRNALRKDDCFFGIVQANNARLISIWIRHGTTCFLDGESSVAFGVGHDEKNHVAADGSQSEEQGPGVPVFKEGESGEAYHRPHAKQGDRFHAPSHPFPRLVTPQVGAEPTGTVQGVVQPPGTTVKQP